MISPKFHVTGQEPRSREVRRLSQLVIGLFISLFFNFIPIGLQLMNDNSLHVFIIRILHKFWNLKVHNLFFLISGYPCICICLHIHVFSCIQ